MNRIEFEVTESLLVDAQARAIQLDPTTRRRLVRSWCVRVAWLLLAGILTYELIADPGPQVFVTSLLIGSAIGLVISFPTPRRIRRMGRAHAAEGVRSDPGYRFLLGWRTVELTADLIVVRTGYGELRFDWRAAVRSRLGGGFLTVTFPGPITVFVPQAAFRYDFEFEEFARDVRRRARAAGGLAADPADG